MDNRQDDLQRLANIAEEYEGNVQIVARAEKSIKNREGASMRRKKSYKWFLAAACCVLVIVAAVWIPVYYLPTADEVIYYSPSSLRHSDIADVEAFQQENGIGFRYFNGPMLQTRAAYARETDDVVYISQEGFVSDGEGFDTVALYVVCMPNSEFDFMRDFERLQDSLIVDSFEIEYYILSQTNQNDCYAKFQHEDKYYYLNIVTSEDGESAIEQYVRLLI